MPPSPTDNIEARLREYLVANPRATDTVGGIASFWLGLAPTPAVLAECERVLFEMAAEGLVERANLPGDVLWRGRPE